MKYIPASVAVKLSTYLFRPQLSERTLSLLIALYIGGVLNSVIWMHTLSSITTSTDVLHCLLTAISVFTFTFLLLEIATFGGYTIYRLFASLLLLFSAIAAYYMSVFNVVIGYGVIVALFTTEMDLSRESVGWLLGLWLIVTALLPLVWLWRVKVTQTTYRDLRKLSTCWKVPVTLFIATYCLITALDELELLDRQQTGTQEMANSAGTLAHRYLPSNWIAAAGMVAYHQYHEHWFPLTLLDPATTFKYVPDPARADTTVIFVIGETARSDHMQLFGYERETTPLLSQEKNLVALRGVSCDTSTYLSLRCMFVREGGTSDDEDRTPKERNVFQTLKALGFSSELFAMQGEMSFYNSVSADNYLLREMISAAPGNENKPVDDMLLIAPLAQSVNSKKNRPHLVILHTKGSHYLYSQRYPRSFARYTPECLSIDAGCSKASLINAFDNSILYTDTLLKAVIDQVRDRKAIVFYSSDHGESIDESTHFHATPLAIAPDEQRRIPIMVWMSDQYLATKGGQLAHNKLQARAALPTPVRHEELFDSILGCIGYYSPDGGIVDSRNWCN